MSDPSDKPDDPAPPADPVTEELVAYLDGELDAPEAEAMATKISLNPALRAEADSLKRTWDVLDMLPRPKPSAKFATQTISQVMPVPPGVSGSSLTTRPAAPVTMIAVSPVEPARRGPWLALAAVAMILGGTAGYVGRGILRPVPDERTRDAEMVNELSLLKNARLYRHVDDMSFLRQLDSPELFAEED